MTLDRFDKPVVFFVIGQRGRASGKPAKHKNLGYLVGISGTCGKTPRPPRKALERNFFLQWKKDPFVTGEKTWANREGKKKTYSISGGSPGPLEKRRRKENSRSVGVHKSLAAPRKGANDVGGSLSGGGRIAVKPRGCPEILGKKKKVVSQSRGGAENREPNAFPLPWRERRKL